MRRSAYASTSSSRSRMSRSSSTTAVSRCTRTSSASSNPMPSGGPPRTLADLRGIPVERLTGVGPALQEKLADMALVTVLDVIQHYPRRWVDRTKKADIASLTVGEEATVFAEVQRVSSRRTRQGRALVEVTVSDG